MSSHSYYTHRCPICGNSMKLNTETRPYDKTSGECLHCGFFYFPQTGQIDLDVLNELRQEHNDDIGLRQEYNDNMGLKQDDTEYLKPLTQADLDKYTDKIKTL